ncbi:MAG: hypothetical protein [Microvirus sp.]|nr:MAG: hypothetical protein [Microvirus sp.]
MKLTLKDKTMLSGALDTEVARVRRAINAERSQAIKELHQMTLNDLLALQGRVSVEVAA